MLHLCKQQFHRELYQTSIILLDLTARSIYNVKAGIYVAWNYREISRTPDMECDFKTLTQK